MILQSTRNTRIPVLPIHEALFFNIRNHEHKVALIDGENDKSYTFSQLAHAVELFGSALSRNGIKKGDVIAMYAPNSSEYCVALLGCLSVGAIMTGVNFNYTAYELQHQLTDSRVKAVFTVSSNLVKVQEVLRKCHLEMIMTLDSHVPGYLYFEDFLRDDGSAFPHDLSFDVKEDVAFILYSSGTTGLPKGVMLTHYNMVSNIFNGVMSGIIPKPGGGQETVVLDILPLFVGIGITMFFSSLISGTTCVTLSGFRPVTFLGSIKKYEVSMLFLVPTLLNFLAKSPLVDQYDLSSVKGVVCGGAPLSCDQEKAFNTRIKPDFTLQAYGMTETVAFVSMSLIGSQKLGASGRLVPNTSAKVIEPSTGKVLSVDEEGEICFKGPQMMKGYLNRPNATRRTVDPEGWLHSGDLGYFDKDGDLFISGRIKELIKHKGFQVSPAEIEGLIMTHPDVNDAAVVGIPDEAAGQLPKAFVVRKPQSSVSAREIADFVKGHLSRHKWLSGGVQFVSSIPKTASGKIIRREVLKMHAASKL